MGLFSFEDGDSSALGFEAEDEKLPVEDGAEDADNNEDVGDEADAGDEEGEDDEEVDADDDDLAEDEDTDDEETADEGDDLDETMNPAADVVEVSDTGSGDVSAEEDDYEFGDEDLAAEDDDANETSVTTPTPFDPETVPEGTVGDE